MLKTHNYIAGEWCPSDRHEVITSVDKYTSKKLGEVQFADEALIERALKGAEKYCQDYRDDSAERKRERLSLLQSGLEKKHEDFSQMIARETGKPIKYARAEVQRALSTLRWAEEESLRFSGEMVPIDYSIGIGRIAYTKKKPIGPVFCMTPFNFPLNLLMHKVAPAIAVGCPVIVKPSPLTPLVAQLFAELVDSIKLDKGLVSVLHLDHEQTQKIITDDRIKAFSFTGSAAVGWQLKKLAFNKKCILELGGDAPAIVCRGSDLEKAARELALSAFAYAGQVCISVQKIFIEKDCYQMFQKLFIEETQKLRVGDPQDATTDLGPLIDRKNFERVKTWIDEACQGGAVTLLKGEFVASKNMIAPWVLADIPEKSKLATEEVFGPVVILESFERIEDTFELVNRSRYGLQASLYCQSIDLMKLAHSRLNFGGVIVNGPPSFRLDSMPYGGHKQSGYGVEGVRYTMEELTQSTLMVF